MTRKPALIAGVALTLIVVAYLVWWPSIGQALQGMHGPFGGGPGMHGWR